MTVQSSFMSCDLLFILHLFGDGCCQQCSCKHLLVRVRVCGYYAFISLSYISRIKGLGYMLIEYMQQRNCQVFSQSNYTMHIVF